MIATKRLYFFLEITISGKNAGNNGAKTFIKDITGRLAANKKAKTGTDINVSVTKRQNVDWEYKIDKDGKKD